MNKKIIFYMIIAASLFLSSCVKESIVNQKELGNGLTKNKGIYNTQDINNVKEAYITILPAQEQKEQYAFTFADLNNDINYKDDQKVEVKIIFQEGKKGSPAKGYYGYGQTSTNGTMRLRGHSSRLAPQKSYRINLDKKAGFWHDFEVINLNKHPGDLLRLRNKLTFDYLMDMDNLISLRTQFVHLYIKDWSEGDYSKSFEDYGLFTHVENIDTDFLRKNGLDTKGWLYKAENFEFFRYKDKIKYKEEIDYSEKDFERVLEIEGNDDHAKLIEMLESVNNPMIHINKIMKQYFDRDNYITWLAVNILLGNIDTISQNYYLYSSTESNKWYFLPWDYDGAWSYYGQTPEYAKNKPPWGEGISNYWSVVLHRRFLMNDKNREDLTRKIDELASFFTNEKTHELLNAYEPIIMKFLNRSPDQNYYPWETGDIYRELNRISQTIGENRRKYYESLQKPMPVFMDKPLDYGNHIVFSWDESYDFQKDALEYILDVSSSPDFKTVIFHKEGIRDTQCILSHLKHGKYYWKLTIKDENGHIQIPFDVYLDAEKNKYFGVQEFYVH